MPDKSSDTRVAIDTAAVISLPLYTLRRPMKNTAGCSLSFDPTRECVVPAAGSWRSRYVHAPRAGRSKLIIVGWYCKIARERDEGRDFIKGCKEALHNAI